MQKLLTILLTTYLTVAAHAAANGIDGEVLVKVGTTGNKAIPSSQTTNVTISSISKVVDGASAVAFSLNSSNALSTSGVNLLTIGNRGTNVVKVGRHGELTLGPTTEASLGVIAENGESIIQVNDATLGFTSNYEILIEGQDYATDTNWSKFSNIDLVGNSHRARTLMESQDHTTNAVIDLKALIEIDTADPIKMSLSFQDAAQPVTYLLMEPTIADASTPYTFDTSLAHTTNNLAEFRNNGTNYFNLEADQSSTNTPITININGTLKRVHVGAPESGGTGLRALTVVN